MSHTNKEKRQKLKVTEDCTACGTCVAMYPEIFEFSDEGHAVVKEDAELSDADIDEITSVCPVGAIKKSNSK
jgi:ferredoxin